MFSVELKKSAKKELDDCPSEYSDKIKKILYFLKKNPHPFKYLDVKKLKGTKNTFRIRIGRYRIIYEVINEEKLILVLKIAKRDEKTYK